MFREFPLLLLLTFASGIASAQTRKTFFDKAGNEVDSARGYAFYRIVEKMDKGWEYHRHYSPGDTLTFEGAFNGDKPEGLHRHYRNSGALYWTDEYLDGKLHGELRSYYPQGQLKRIERYRTGEFQSGECFQEDGSPRGFTRMEQVPEFPGGEAAMKEFIKKNFEYPRKARKNGVEGQVLVSFVVDKTGEVTDIKVIRDIGWGCGQEAVRLLRIMPRWTPGFYDDNPLKVRYSMPFNFYF